MAFAFRVPNPSQPARHAASVPVWLSGTAGMFRNAFHFMCLFDRSDRELAARGLTRGALVTSYIGSFETDLR